MNGYEHKLIHQKLTELYSEKIITINMVQDKKSLFYSMMMKNMKPKYTFMILPYIMEKSLA